jgi:uncharacterized protein YdhG (YjbR/CyaY superfamily)
MDKNQAVARTIDEFIAGYPPATQGILQELRRIIHSVAPGAGEKISYGIPTFTLHGNLVHFSAYKHHIGFYPGAEAIEVFADQLTEYQCSKGTVQFPLDKPIPYELVKKITVWRVEKALKTTGEK